MKRKAFDLFLDRITTMASSLQFMEARVDELSSADYELKKENLRLKIEVRELTERIAEMEMDG